MNVVEEYLSHVDEPEKTELKRVASIVKSAAPDAEEVITYGMPGFKYKGKYLISFSAFKDHMSIFPGAGPTERLRDELSGYKLSKGTIQFTLEKPLPESVIRELVTTRMESISNK